MRISEVKDKVEEQRNTRDLNWWTSGLTLAVDSTGVIQRIRFKYLLKEPKKTGQIRAGVLQGLP